MSNHIAQANIPRSSATFEFVSKFPKLHMPSYKVASQDLVNPKKADCLQDGELVQVTGNSIINKIADPGTLANFQNVYISHGKIGRTDLQATGARPVIKETDFEFRTRLVDAGATFTEGSFAAPAVLLLGDYAGTCGLAPVTTPAAEYVAVYLKNEGDGWHLFRWQRGKV